MLFLLSILGLNCFWLDSFPGSLLKKDRAWGVMARGFYFSRVFIAVRYDLGG